MWASKGVGPSSWIRACCPPGCTFLRFPGRPEEKSRANTAPPDGCCRASHEERPAQDVDVRHARVAPRHEQRRAAGRTPSADSCGRMYSCRETGLWRRSWNRLRLESASTSSVGSFPPSIRDHKRFRGGCALPRRTWLRSWTFWKTSQTQTSARIPATPEATANAESRAGLDGAQRVSASHLGNRNHHGNGMEFDPVRPGRHTETHAGVSALGLIILREPLAQMVGPYPDDRVGIAVVFRLTSEEPFHRSPARAAARHARRESSRPGSGAAVRPVCYCGNIRFLEPDRVHPRPPREARPKFSRN